MHITLRANEKIYINGAVLKPDRKVSLELMNDAVFLLQAHVMTEADATTPMRQLYYIVQLMLMEPSDLAINGTVFQQQCAAMAGVYRQPAILDGLAKVAALVGRRRHFDALKVIRSLLPLEQEMIAPAAPLARAS
jgi:flagellar biosynthesis repressor protein FlbT